MIYLLLYLPAQNPLKNGLAACISASTEPDEFLRTTAVRVLAAFRRMYPISIALRN